MRLRLMLVVVLLLSVQAMHAQYSCLPVPVNQTLQMSSATVVQGSVKVRRGAYVPDLSLTLKGSRQSKLKMVVKTDSLGRFHFDQVPAGKYTLSIYQTAGSATHPVVNCSTSGVCSVAFRLKPTSGKIDCQRQTNPEYGICRGIACSGTKDPLRTQ